MKKIKKTFKFSPSSLNLMEECPRCFWIHQTQNPNQRDSKFYKSQILHIIRMFPSDPTGSLDDFIFGFLAKYLNLKGSLQIWKKH